MSVLIKGLTKEKVESCFRFAKDGWCIFDMPEIIELPLHGRLIDADALEYHAETVRDTEDGHRWLVRVIEEDQILDAPTIIESEGE